MKKIIIAATFVTLTSMTGLTTFANAATVQCEDSLKTLAETMAKTKLSPADLKAVNDLKAKAEERCTAEDDKRSNGFVADAMKIMGK